VEQLKKSAVGSSQSAVTTNNEMIEILKAFDPETNNEVKLHHKQRVVNETSLPRIRRKAQEKYRLKHVLFITKNLIKEE